MKLMKHITIALVLCAIPAMAFGQTVTCDDCTHAVSVYMGEGGLIATADDADEVTYVSSCAGVTRTGELEANDDGVVAMLFTMDNGLACHATGKDMGSLELGPITDGGWYWITDDMNSAIGNLVAKDVLENEAVELTSAGSGVTMSMGSGASFVKETASGRVGILPNILPEPPADPAEICGPRRTTSWPYPYATQMNKSCMLGAGKTKIRLVGPGAYGARAMITNGMVYRPTVGDITVTADLWVDEMGSYTTTDSNDGGYAAAVRKGWIGKTARGQGDHNTNWLTATFAGSLGQAVGDPTTLDSTGAGGVALTADGSGSSPAGQATFTISANADYCSSSNNNTATVTIYATPGTNAVHPPIAVGRAAHGLTSSALAGVTAITQLRVVCAPASSSSKGTELVPDNPFPTER